MGMHGSMAVAKSTTAAVTEGPRTIDLADGSWTLYDPDGVISSSATSSGGVVSVPVAGDDGSEMGTSSSNSAVYYREALDQDGNAITWGESKRIVGTSHIDFDNVATVQNGGIGLGWGFIYEGVGTTTPKWIGYVMKFDNGQAGKGNLLHGGSQAVATSSAVHADAVDAIAMVGRELNSSSGIVRGLSEGAYTYDVQVNVVLEHGEGTRNVAGSESSASSGTLYECIFVGTYMNSTSDTIQFHGSLQNVVIDAPTS